MPDSGVPDAGTPTATLTLSDAPTYDYGTRPVGIAIDRAFTVTNSGTGPASSLAPEATGGLATPFSFKGGSYPGQGGTCAATLEAGQSCTVVVTYAPSATGASTGTLALGYNDGTAARTVSRALTGNAVPPASLELSDAPLYDYGQKATGSSTDHAFTLTNRGGFIANTVVPAPGLTGPFNYKGGFYPGDGGTCTSTLDPGASCTVVVTYAPVSSGTATATVTVSYHDGLSARTATRDVRGGASAPAQVSISDGAVYDFGTRAVGSTVDKTFTVSNPGGLAATDLVASGLSAPFSFKGGSYPGEGGTCGTSLPSLGSCTLVVTYAPTSLGTVTQTLSLAYNDGGNTRTATREVRGTAINPAWLSLSDAPTFHYGTRAVGSSTDHTFTVTNSGGVTATGVGATLMLRAPFSFKGGGYPGQGGTCTSTLPANASCTVVVTFAPTSSGSFTSTVGILYFDGAATRTATRTVTGAGTTEAFLAISDGPVFDFGVHAAGSSTDHAFTVTNTGNRTATAITAGMLSAPFSYKGGAYPGVGGTCGASLAVNATCTVVVTFAPVVAGVRTDTLSLAYNDGNGAQTASVGLRGTGTGRAALSLSDGPTYDYGALPLGATADHAFTVTNSGADTATNINPGPLSAPFAFKGGSYPGQGGTCGASLAVNATCTL
ncbi:MAG TPA: choice-of-anchor D domain-containing protein, partial [Myxococcaceae bacterium]|nr:choice-of-anchor D domain-containing protein [Myxococcaceae bacterium]